MQLKEIVEQQHLFFQTNATKSIRYRICMLKKLYHAIEDIEEELYVALKQDLNKSRAEAYMTEIGLIYSEIKVALKNVETWSKPQKVKGTLATFPAKNYMYKEPFGVTLILAPWNYPFQLAMAPLIGSIAAGNCAVLKCSKSSSHTSRLIQRMIHDTFHLKYIHCVEAKIDYDEVLNQRYDYIFFTGSPSVGKTVMKAASENLTPVSLELGGKSPCFIDKTADIKVAAKRIVWGKFLNAGQTCISIDYILVDKKVKKEFIFYLQKEIQKRYDNAQLSENYPKIINQRHYDRLCGLIDRAGCYIGGERNPSERKIAPTILTDVSFEDEIMKEEIFGPILPIMEYTDIEDTITTVKKRPKPLACYIFTKDKAYADKLMDEVSYGGGCVNDVLMHVSNHHMPFGGVGNSGMGGYHGKYTFDTFSHTKSMVKNTTFFDIPIRYAPFNEAKLSLLKKFL